MDGIFCGRLRHEGAGRRANCRGGNASHASPEYRQRRRSSFTERRRLVGTHWLDHYRQGNASQYRRVVAVCSRPAKAKVLHVDQQVSLGAVGGKRRNSLRHRWMGLRDVGRFSAHSGRPSRYLAGELRDAHVGFAAFHDCDLSTNSFWVAILTFGEGWHNNHHASPQSARHGLAWYEIDMNWYGISTLRTLGLAWDVKLQKLRRASGRALEADPVIVPVAAEFEALMPTLGGD